MLQLDLQKLVKSLDIGTRAYFEQAAERCVNRGGNEIVIEDLLLVMLDNSNGILNAALEQFNIEQAKVTEALQHGLKLQSGESSNPVFSRNLVQWIQEAYEITRLEFDVKEIGEGAMLLALLTNPIRYQRTAYYRILSEIPIDEFRNLLKGLYEEGKEATIQQQAKPKGVSELSKFTENLTQLARDRKIDPVLGRDEEIGQMIDILSRRRKNNPIIVGEAGVGKTALVEGLALVITGSDPPIHLATSEIYSLDIGALQAGAGVKGEFERRLKMVIDEVQRSETPIILFIDEAHTIIGAGNAQGSGDAANLLKPALARGELRTIGATTWSEYGKYFEKDAALTRRFQPVFLNEPTVEDGVTIIRGLAKKYEQEHGVYISDEAIKSAVSLSKRYITGRQLPDKAVDLIDTACARVKISQSHKPQKLVKLESREAALIRERSFIQRDHDNKIGSYEKELESIGDELEHLRDEIECIERDWNAQKDLVEKIQKASASPDLQSDSETDSTIEVDSDLENSADIGSDNDSLEDESLRRQLAELHEKYGIYVHTQVDTTVVADIVSAWTGVPLGSLENAEAHSMVNFPNQLRERIKGQDNALDIIERELKIRNVGLGNPDAPRGVFLLVGPSGSGKTETALRVTDILYGGERFLTTINMSEFQEKHTVSRLMGAPPGYVGYGEGGQLTDAVKKRPYSVLLFDEIEKSHPDILNIFYQIFDKGVAYDGEGRKVDFKNTTIFLTSNLASREINEFYQKEEPGDYDDLIKAITPLISHYLSPALMGRLILTPFVSLSTQAMKEIVHLKYQTIVNRLKERGIDIIFDEKLYDLTVSNAKDSQSGARNIDLIINTHITPVISNYLLENMAQNKDVSQLTITILNNGNLSLRSS